MAVITTKRADTYSTHCLRPRGRKCRGGIAYTLPTATFLAAEISVRIVRLFLRFGPLDKPLHGDRARETIIPFSIKGGHVRYHRDGCRVEWTKTVPCARLGFPNAGVLVTVFTNISCLNEQRAERTPGLCKY